MDTWVHPKVHGYRREDFIEDKGLLMDRSRVMRDEGAERLMEKMHEDYRRAEERRADNR